MGGGPSLAVHNLDLRSWGHCENTEQVGGDRVEAKPRKQTQTFPCDAVTPGLAQEGNAFWFSLT